MVCGWLHIMWVELPPRARRIPRGTASNHSPGRNYLRVRGEYHLAEMISKGLKELPPRARRIPHVVSTVSHSPGTTSACAENTVYRDRGDWAGWNYLRVRGEYVGEPLKVNDFLELPPRARRIPSIRFDGVDPFGTTSACAENTAFAALAAGIAPELPPRARRILTP